MNLEHTWRKDTIRGGKFIMKKILLLIIPLMIIILFSGSAFAIASSIQTSKFFVDESGNELTTANVGDTVYGMIYVHNGIPDNTADLNINGISNPSIQYTGSYSASYDDQMTWIPNDGTFNPDVGWQISDMPSGTVYWLKETFIVTGCEPDLTITDYVMPMANFFEGSPQIKPPSELKINKNKHTTRTTGTSKTKITALTPANLNPTYYAALLRMNK